MTEIIKIKEIADQAGTQNNCRIYDIYKHRDRLQIFIDKKQSDTKIQLKDCENVFHSLRFLLNLEMPHILEKFRLEVSSPGIEKRLREKWHYEESIGQWIKWTTHSPIQIHNTNTGKKFSTQAFLAQLISLSNETLNLQTDSTQYSIPFEKIKSAQITFKTKQTKEKTKNRLSKKNKSKSEVSNVS